MFLKRNRAHWSAPERTGEFYKKHQISAHQRTVVNIRETPWCSATVPISRSGRHSCANRSVGCRLVIPAGASCAAGTRLLPTSCFRPRSPCGHSGPRQNGRRAPLRPQHGLTACRRPLQIFSAGSGIHPPSPLRKSARALRLPRTCDTRSHAYLSRKLRSGVLPPVPYRAVRWE